MKYKIGTRGSKLALKQTMDVIAKLEQLYPEESSRLSLLRLQETGSRRSS